MKVTLGKNYKKVFTIRDLESARKAETGMRIAYGEEVKEIRVQKMTESEIRRNLREDMLML